MSYERDRADRDLMKRILVGDRRDLYLNNVEFKYSIDWFVEVIPMWVDGLATSCESIAAERLERLRLLEVAPLDVGNGLIQALKDAARGDVS